LHINSSMVSMWYISY